MEKERNKKGRNNENLYKEGLYRKEPYNRLDPVRQDRRKGNLSFPWTRIFRRMIRGKVHRNVKDRLFRFIFGNDREALLELYNALNGTDYREAGELEVVTVEDIIYMSMKNDLAFTLAGYLNLYEQQSTVCPNIPLRFFIYLGEEYQKLVVETGMEKLYGTKLLELPAPRCVVLYNGSEEEAEERELCLSEAFGEKGGDSSLELRVRLININYGHNEELMKKCHRLWEYSYFVEQVNAGLRAGKRAREAAEEAIEVCLEEGILEDVLTASRMEVLGMLLCEFDEKKDRENLWQEGLEQGLERGLAQGLEQGREEGFAEGQSVGVKKSIKLCRSLNLSYDQTMREIVSLYELSEEEGLDFMRRFWEEQK